MINYLGEFFKPPHPLRLVNGLVADAVTALTDTQFHTFLFRFLFNFRLHNISSFFVYYSQLLFGLKIHRGFSFNITSSKEQH